MTIEEIVPKWLEYKRPFVKESTFASYVLASRVTLLPEFGRCDKITEDMVQDFALKCLAKGLSKRTIGDRLMVLKMIVKFASSKKWMEYCEWKVIYPTSTNAKAEINVLTPAEHKKTLDYIKDHFTFRALGIYISLTAGLRIGEVCGLKWEDVDCEKGIIRVQRTVERIYVADTNARSTKIVINTPKTTASRRDVPMCKELLSMMKPLKKVVNEKFYVLTNAENPTEPRAYRKFFHELMKKIGMPLVRYHDLRHTFATRCIESKCDYKTVSALLGHSSISITLDMYVHPDTSQKRNAVNKMFKALGR